MRIPETAAPRIKNRSWTLTAKLKADGTKTQGVIMAFGGVAAGMAFYVRDGVPVFDYDYFEEHTMIKSGKPLPAGEATVELDFNYEGGGLGKAADIALKVNGEKVGEGKV